MTNMVFRSKFEKVVTDANREALMSAFQQFCKFTPDNAIKQLWRMGYTSKAYNTALENGAEAIEALKPYITETLSVLGLNDEQFPLESMDLLRNELRFQYEQKVPNFLEAKMDDAACETAYEMLKNQTDSIIANVVYNHCIERIYITGVERVLFLLNSDEEKNSFGGIRSLHFSKVESNYLKPFHKQIHELLKAMYDHKVQTEVARGTQNPFEKLAGMFEEEVSEEYQDEEPLVTETETVATPVTEEVDAPTKILAEEVVTVSEDVSESNAEEERSQEKAYMPLTPEVIFAQKYLFQAFVNSDMNALVEIGRLGLDLNEVMAKKEKISDLIAVIEAFDK